MQPELICMQMRPKRQIGLGSGADEVLCGTPFDPLFHSPDRVHFSSNLFTWLRVCMCVFSCMPVHEGACTLSSASRSAEFSLMWLNINPRIVRAFLALLLSLWKCSQFVGDTSLVGVRISVGGHRSASGGSDKLWNVKDQFLPHVSVLGEHCQAVSRHHV